MTFRIIEGGSPESPTQKKKQLSDKVEQLKIFVSHMRSLEKSIASIKSMAHQIEWDDLDKRLTSCHDQILDTLSFVKKSTNDKKQDRLNLDKPIKTKLKIVKLKDKE
jgi:prefoldin subunit 5